MVAFAVEIRLVCGHTVDQVIDLVAAFATLGDISIVTGKACQAQGTQAL